MELNILEIVLATVAQFAVGAVWYSALFGKLWGQIHGFDKLTPEVQKEMASKMGPFYGLQFLVTIITSVVLACFISLVPGKSPFVLSALVWIGFIVPTQVGAVIFGGTPAEWIVKKLFVMASASLVCLMAAAAVFHFV